MGAKEPFDSALVRAGVGHREAGQIAEFVANEFDVVNPHPGLALAIEISPELGAVQRLSFQARPETNLAVWRDESGHLRLSRDETPTFRSLSLVQGRVNGSLYLSIVSAGGDVEEAARVTAGFGARLDLVRDIESGDRFRCVFDHRTAADGHSVGPKRLLYAELTTSSGKTSFYGDGSGTNLVDGGAGAPLLLRTPVDATRISSPFGMRMHPILGFSRMHQGVDFAASIGAPVLAAGDGVVEEARWAGGYGRWLKIRHRFDLETAYAHLSAWAPGIGPGDRVRQGQVVGYVGETGLATGPHLHYEVIEAGRPVDPRSVAGLGHAEASTATTARARKALIDAEVVSLNAG